MAQNQEILGHFCLITPLFLAKLPKNLDFLILISLP